MDVSSMLNTMNMVLLGIFIAILAILFISFLRGLGRGWRYGTFRLVFYGLLILGAILSLKAVGNSLADVNLNNFGIPDMIGQHEVSFDLEELGVTISAPITSVRETGVSLISQALEAYGVKADPSTLFGLATALVLSFVCIILLIVEALLIWLVGGLLCFLLWHIIFKHFINPKNEEGKRSKKLRLVSALEEVAVSAAILAMFISPLTALVNTVSKTYSRIPKSENHEMLRANNEFYSVLTDVVDTYENSLLSKTFFGWYTDPTTGLSFDAALIDFITTINIDETGEKKLSVMRELQNVIELAGTTLNSGIFNEEGFEKINMGAVLTSDIIPTAIRVIGRSELVQTVLPIGLEFAVNLPAIADYIKTEEGIDFSNYDPAETFDDLANLWTSVAHSGILDDLIDENGDIISDSDHMVDVFKIDYKSIFDSIFKFFSPSEKKVIDDIICAGLYVEAVKEYEAMPTANPDEFTFGVKDILPELTEDDIRRSEAGYPVAVPESIKSIDFGYELQVIFDSLFEIVTVDTDFLHLIFDPIFEGNGGSSASSSAATSSKSADEEIGRKAIQTVLKHKDQVEHWIDGKEAAGTSADDLCLLDSNLLTNAIPKVLELLERTIEDAIGPGNVSLSGIVADFKAEPTMEAKKTASKTEARAIFDILTPLLNSEEGHEFIEHIDTMPGLYFDKDNNFLGAKKGLLYALADSVTNVDKSKVLSTAVPGLISNFLSGESNVLKNLFGEDVVLDTECVDSNGKSIFGSEIAKLIRVLADCEDIIGFANTLSSSTSDIHSLERSFTQMCSLETDSHEKQIVKLLSAFASNKIINPEIDGKKNANFYGLFKNIFSKLGLGGDDLNDSMEAIICDASFDAESEVTSFIDLIDYICGKGLLGSLSSFSLDSMTNIKFGELFAKVDNSDLLKTILGTIIDSSISSNNLFTYENDSGVTIALSFKNITNWAEEGEALDKMTKYAAQFGDLSNISLDSFDPGMMEAVFGYLAKSQLFVKTNADGTYDYNFPSYISSKLIEAFKGSSDLGKYFTNLTETYSVGEGYKVVAAGGTLNEDYSDFKARVLAHSVTNATNFADIQAEQNIFIHEGELFGEIIKCISASGALDLMNGGSGTDFSKFRVEYFRILLEDMSESVLFGKTGVASILNVVVDTLSSTLDSFKATNVMYAYNCTDVERLEVADSIADILTIVTDPVSGLLAPDGTLDASSLNSLSDLDANHLIAPLLKSFAQNEVFNTLSVYQTNVANLTDTAFDGQMLSVLKQAGWYGTDEKAEAIFPTLKQLINTNGGWDSEIDRFVEIVDDLSLMGIDLSSSFDFNSYFEEARFGEDILSNLFIDINDSCLLYPGFPEKLDSALSTVDSSLSSSGLNLDNANLYYAGKATIPTTAYEYAPIAYGDDECYNLASVIRYGSSLSGGINVNDITAVPSGDIDNITELLGTFAKSHIFNSKKSGASDTVFQEFIAKILTTNEHVEDFIYDVKSPKDIANSALYGNATEKAKYIASFYYPEVPNIVTDANDIDTTNITGIGVPNSINTLLKRFTSDATLINDLDHTSLSDLNPTELSDLLIALNNCDWTYDAVPNAVAQTIDQVSLEDVKLSRSNPYYGYNYAISFDEGSGTYVKPSTMTRLVTPNFTNHYDNDEIVSLADTIGLINGDPTALTDFSSKANITKVRNILDGLNESYIFSRDGACYALEADDSLADTKTDLSVFEQSMYKVFKDSTLAELSYSETIDGEFADSEAKLLSKIKNFPADKWEDELAAMLINDTEDAGLLCTAFDLGIISGSNVSLDTDTLEGLSPSQIGELLYAVNEVDMIREIIPLQASDFLSNKLHFSNYTTATVTYLPNATTFEIPVTTPVNSLKITYSGSHAPVVSYAKAGSNYVVAPNVINTIVNEYVINDGSAMTDIVLGDAITVTCDGNMSRIELSFDANALIGMNKARLDTYNSATDTHKGAINSFISMINKLYTPGHGYVDFDSTTAIADLFNEDGNLTALSDFAKNGDSIYTRVYNNDNEEAASGVYTGGDIVLSNLLSFHGSYGVTVNLARYLPNYDENDFTSVYKDLYTIFVGANPNCLTSEEIADVTEWLDGNIMDVAFFYAAYENGKQLGGMVGVSSGIDSVQTLGPSPKNILQYIHLNPGHVWNSFEAKFKSGFGRVFYEDMKEYALTNKHFNNGNNLSATNFRPDANSYAHFISLMEGTVIPLLINIKPGSISNKPLLRSIFQDYSENMQTYPDADVVVAFYEGTVFEFLVSNDSRFATQPIYRQTPWGTSGYFDQAAGFLA